MKGVSEEVINEKADVIRAHLPEDVEVSYIPYKEGFGLFLTYHRESDYINAPLSIDNVPVAGAGLS
jgi:hypothetical protein